MQPRILKVGKIEYQIADWDGVNRSGVVTVGDMILVMVDKAATKTKGLIELTEDTIHANQLAGQTGIVVSIGEGAYLWTRDRARPFAGRKPEIGDRIWFQRYAGFEIYGEDGAFYRVLSDVSIGAIYTSGPAAGKRPPSA